MGDGSIRAEPLLNETFTANFTVAAWVKRETINEYAPIYDAGTGSDDWWFFISGNVGGTANDNRLSDTAPISMRWVRRCSG